MKTKWNTTDQLRTSLKIGALLLFGLQLTGCAGLTHRKDDVAVKNIKSVAIVAFTSVQPAPATVGLNLSSGKVEGGAGGSMITQESEHVNQMYFDLKESLEKKLQWKVLTLNGMKSSPAYVKEYKATMEGWQNKMPPGEGRFKFGIAGIMDTDSPRIMGPERRKQLARDLGVDAIVVAQVNVYLKGTTVMGIGSRKPQSNLSLYVYDRNADDPVWFEGGVEGEESTESVGSTGFWDPSLLNELAKKSAKTAFDKLSL